MIVLAFPCNRCMHLEGNTFNLAGFSRKFIGTGVILSQKQRAISLSAYPPVNNS